MGNALERLIRCTEGFSEIIWISPQTPSAERWFDGLPVAKKSWRPWGPEFSASVFKRTAGSGRPLFLWNPAVHPASRSSLKTLSREFRPGERLALLLSSTSTSANGWLHELHEAGFERLRETRLGDGYRFILFRRPVRWTPLPSLSVVVPIFNQAGNIASILSRLSGFDKIETEVLFVEGESQDDSWRAIGRACERYTGHLKLRALRQPGVGRADALNWGFSRAEGRVFGALGGDLATPPESLRRFYDAFVEGRADLIYGDRFRLPAEHGTLPVSVRLGNAVAAKAASWRTGKDIRDVFCGMKLLSAEDYRAVLRWRGRLESDFALLLGASAVGLTLLDLPVPYKPSERRGRSVSLGAAVKGFLSPVWGTRTGSPEIL